MCHAIVLFTVITDREGGLDEDLVVGIDRHRSGKIYRQAVRPWTPKAISVDMVTPTALETTQALRMACQRGSVRIHASVVSVTADA